MKSGKVSRNIKEAIENNSYLKGTGVNQRVVTLGNVEEGLKNSDIVVEGENYMGGQEHTYFETHNCIIYPHEDGYILCYSSTQNPAKMQYDIALNLNDPKATEPPKDYPW